METLLAWMLTLSLGFDALIVSASLGLRKETKYKIKTALVFASAETLMPIAGMMIGGALGHLFQGALSIMGALLLIGVAIYFLFLEKEEDEHAALGHQLTGWPLIAVAIGISLDELAVGFSAGLMQAPIVLTITLIAVQSFALSMIGITFGAKFKPYLGEWAEKASGLMLGLIGLWMLIDTLPST
ncbi:manganese efflux pump MntP [Paenibacillus xylaniclasticus]|uniref:manganese efflux pump MntP n=1 Tax=Paenibacillus xylaniclasticus TaxID=588083 RepID=UPI000FDAB9DD|nr:MULTISPECIES: manganese efflux pump [Paenibacillus]GFN32263.1 putative manganese efflux pump MntP [Paenibacillus curdlanolyticus]